MGYGSWGSFRAGCCHPQVRSHYLTSCFAALLYVVTCDWTQEGRMAGTEASLAVYPTYMLQCKYC